MAAESMQSKMYHSINVRRCFLFTKGACADASWLPFPCVDTVALKFSFRLGIPAVGPFLRSKVHRFFCHAESLTTTVIVMNAIGLLVVCGGGGNFRARLIPGGRSAGGFR